MTDDIAGLAGQKAPEPYPKMSPEQITYRGQWEHALMLPTFAPNWELVKVKVC